jgi:hypothetical protein
MESFREAFVLSADEVKGATPPGTVRILGKSEILQPRNASGGYGLTDRTI